MMRPSQIDAVLDLVGENASKDEVADALVGAVEVSEDWDWEGDAYQPETRVAVVESSGGFWAVGHVPTRWVRGRPTGGYDNRARVFATRPEAEALVDSWCGA